MYYYMYSHCLVFSDIRRYNAICFDFLCVFSVFKSSMSFFYHCSWWKVAHVYMLSALNIHTCFKRCHRIWMTWRQCYLCFAFIFTSLTLYSAIMHFIIRIYHLLLLCNHVLLIAFLDLFYTTYWFTIPIIWQCFTTFLRILLFFLCDLRLLIKRRRVSVGTVASILRWVTLALAWAMLFTIISLDIGII